LHQPGGKIASAVNVLMTSFQDNVSKPVPECETTLNLATARDDRDDSGETTVRRAKAPVESPPSTYQHLVFTCRMLFQIPSQQCQSNKANKSQTIKYKQKQQTY